MIRRLLRLVLLTLPLTACTAPLQGPTVDLATIATPDPVPQAVRVVPPPAPGPTVGAGRMRAWVPRQVQPNGDTTEGYWMDISLAPPPAETVEPVTPMPRAPKIHGGQKPAAQSQPQIPAQPTVPPVATPTPVLPSGLLRGSQTSPLRSLLGGQ